MKKLNLLVWGNLVLVLGAASWIIQQKEDLLENGRLVLLEVGRYDPRSLMQGDYMQLRYEISRTIGNKLPEGRQPDGVVVLAVDENDIGTFRRFYEGEALAADEQLLRYKVRHGHWNRVRVAAESYFFQEGTAAEYERAARYVELRVDAEGRTLLVALRDEKRRRLGERDKEGKDK
ncbi:MAG: GDYXXLXY domain-containing protein [Planctomycetota bacterium]|jgi:uncharacterized membrane-anchored protein